jgi:putative RecB family exonuclease
MMGYFCFRKGVEMFTDKTLEELRNEPHLSASGILDYITCGLSYKFGRVDSVEKESTSDVLVLGKAIHRTLESYYWTKQQGHSCARENLLSVFEHHWRNECESTENIWWNDGNTYESLLEYGKQLMEVYLDNLPQNDFKVVGIEVPFRFEIPGVPVPIIGCIDLILQDEHGTVIIVDHKTCNKSYSRSDVDKSLQLTIYHMAMKEHGFKDEDILLRFDCLIKTTKPKFEQYYTSRTSDDAQRLVKTVQSVWTAINKEVFVPNDMTWKCGYCSYRKQCTQWFLN